MRSQYHSTEFPVYHDKEPESGPLGLSSHEFLYGEVKSSQVSITTTYDLYDEHLTKGLYRK